MEKANFNLPVKKKKISVRVVSFLDKVNLLKNKKKFLGEIIKELKSLGDRGHIGGFLEEKEPREQLEKNIFDKKKFMQEYPNKIEFSKIINLTKETLNKIKNILGKRKILIYIFPTDSYFIAKNMDGSSGFLVWRNIIHIYLYPKKRWEINFKSTLLHELAHCMQNYYSYNMTLFEHLIADGLAEHFQKEILHKKRDPWTKAISKKEAKKIFKKLKSKLNKTINEDPSIHFRLFFGNKDFPIWTGYTIGYYLVEDYLKQNKNIEWKKLLSKKPDKFKRKLKNWFVS